MFCDVKRGFLDLIWGCCNNLHGSFCSRYLCKFLPLEGTFLMYLAMVWCSEGRQLVGRKWRRERPSTALESEGMRWNMDFELARLSEL